MTACKKNTCPLRCKRSALPILLALVRLVHGDPFSLVDLSLVHGMLLTDMELSRP